MPNITVGSRFFASCKATRQYKSKIPGILFVLGLSLLSACSHDKNPGADTTAPVISLTGATR